MLILPIMSTKQLQIHIKILLLDRLWPLQVFYFCFNSRKKILHLQIFVFNIVTKISNQIWNPFNFTLIATHFYAVSPPIYLYLIFEICISLIDFCTWFLKAKFKQIIFTGIYGILSILTIVGASSYRLRNLIIPYLVIQMVIIVITVLSGGKFEKSF